MVRHMVTRYALDDSARRVDDGTVLIGGSPLSIFRLSDTGARVLERLIGGEPPPHGAERLTERLLDAGAADRRPERGPFTVADVTVVIPVHDGDVAYGLRLHVQGRQLAHLTGADHGHAAPGEVPENLARERHRGVADRHRSRTETGFAPHPFADRE